MKAIFLPSGENWGALSLRVEEMTGLALLAAGLGLPASPELGLTGMGMRQIAL
jgi:hypothetical protein